MHLFVYGVLREGLGDWPFLAGIGPGRAASASGALFAIDDPQGWYPALVPGEGMVSGALHPCDTVELAAVDAFEGADYARRPIPVQCAGEAIMAEAYLWAAPLPPGALPIPHGDFARWLAETGHPPFGKHP
ncbi:MAG: gamma-glutamylcyclotransferase [Erythrobacter sp.]|uniref:gamma-glutamylcyclotransferase family protein n=1 Tax=Erythrobacter sp. TaxID=1042 RepID=UPI0025ED2B3D|nr:gamma-glutamylcyclotransferase family protein [Erythrobacter sp.]MCL9999407.1 gamma-glutamylcyclotransferase [Erythrobacter sp.]